jgi:acetolactate synthase-1/2/3 large subunit
MSLNEGQSGTVTVGDALAETLARAGVKIAFTVPGESLLGLLEGLTAHKIRIVTTRHEGAASFMADAVAQLTGRPTLLLAGRAPGAANLTIGLHAAQSDSAPVIAIVGQVRRDVRGREAFQEMDLVRAFEPIVKWAAEAKDAAEVASLGEKAVATAMKGRPGPVLLAVPEDLLDVRVPGGQLPANRIEHPVEPDPGLVRKALHLLLEGRKPLIVAGAGVLRSRSTDALVRFAETVQVPVVSSWRRGDVFPNDHPLYLGMTGLGSPRCVRARLETADALLVVGCRMGEMTTFGYSIPVAGTRWAQIDAEPRGTSLPEHPEIVVAADVSAFLRASQRALANSALDAASFDARRVQNAVDRDAFEAASIVGEEPWDGPGVHPGRVVATLGKVLPADTIVTTDAGDFGTWAARGYRFHRPGTFLGSTSGSMGYGLPAAIGATLARPGRLGVALAGDGGFAMTMAELETAVRERARVIAIVFDNGRYGTIWRHQRLRGGQAGLATKLGAVDFAAVAEACGALGISVSSDGEFEPALRRAIEAGRPAVLHLVLDPRWTTPDELPWADEAALEPEVAMEPATTEAPADIHPRTAESLDVQASEVAEAPATVREDLEDATAEEQSAEIEPIAAATPNAEAVPQDRDPDPALTPPAE